jgi:hypothetical protein
LDADPVVRGWSSSREHSQHSAFKRDTATVPKGRRISPATRIAPIDRHRSRAFGGTRPRRERNGQDDFHPPTWFAAAQHGVRRRASGRAVARAPSTRSLRQRLIRGATAIQRAGSFSSSDLRRRVTAFGAVAARAVAHFRGRLRTTRYASGSFEARRRSNGQDRFHPLTYVAASRRSGPAPRERSRTSRAPSTRSRRQRLVRGATAIQRAGLISSSDLRRRVTAFGAGAARAVAHFAGAFDPLAAPAARSRRDGDPTGRIVFIL